MGIMRYQPKNKVKQNKATTTKYIVVTEGKKTKAKRARKLI